MAATRTCRAVLREQQGLSISDMADRTGVDRAMIRRLENAQLGNPTLAAVGRYAQALGQRVVVTLGDAAAKRGRELRR